MKKSMFLSIILLLFASGPSFAQGLSGETEVGTDGNGEGFFSQYLFYDFKHVNVLTRYFWVNEVLQRGEFAVGPTLELNNGNVLKLQFGSTTDKDVMIAGTLIAKVKGRGILYIADGKLATQAGLPNTLYQKLFVSLTANGTWQFRIEYLQVGDDQSFLRIGPEYQHKLNNKQLFIAPQFDPIRKQVGGQIGVRFF